MMTWILWDALKKPFIRHPVFRRALKLRKAGVGEVSFIKRPMQKLLERYQQLTSSIISRILLLILMLPAAGFAIIAILYGGVTVLMYGGPVLLPIVSNMHGLAWALGIGSLIATERERGTYDLLCVTPYGTWQTTWAIASGYAHYDRTLLTVNNLRAWQLAVIWIVMPFIGSMAILQFGNFGDYLLRIPLFIVYLGAFTAMLYIDQFQSIVVGVLTGMLAPQFTRTTQETRLWIIGVFTLLQTATYLLAFFLCLGVLPKIYELLGLRGWLAEITVPAFGVLIFYVLHEAVIRGLWALLRDRVGAEDSWVESYLPDAV